MTSLTNYQSPVSKLLTLGDYRGVNKEGYDYIAELSFGSQHIPELIQIAVDKELIGSDSDSLDGSLQKWAPIHAWRILALLPVEDGIILKELHQAIASLMELFHELEDNDWVAEEIPKVYGIIGENAIAPLRDYIKDETHGIFPRVTAVNSLQEIATQHSQARSKCIAVLSEQLKLFAENPNDLNTFIITSLIELRAKESALLIKNVLIANKVDEHIVGSWEEVQEHLGITVDELESLIEIQVTENEIEKVTIPEDLTPTHSVDSETNPETNLEHIPDIEDELSIEEISSDSSIISKDSKDEIEEVTIPENVTPTHSVDLETNLKTNLEYTPHVENGSTIEPVNSDPLPIENVDRDKIETDIPEKADNKTEDVLTKIEEKSVKSTKSEVSTLPDFHLVASSTQKNLSQGFGKKNNSQSKSKKAKKKKR
ncbi:MAG: DUF1186 domain-containing protein [Cyanobacteria bacterium P01_A01_bin.84]